MRKTRKILSVIVAICFLTTLCLSIVTGDPWTHHTFQKKKIPGNQVEDLPTEGEPQFVYTVDGCLECEEGNCENMEFIVDGNDLTYLHYAEMIYNCCAEMIVQLEMETGLIRFIELEHFIDGPCDCICDFKLSGTVFDLASDEYTIEVWAYFNEGDGQELLCQTTVFID